MWFVPWDGPDPGQPFSFVVQLATRDSTGRCTFARIRYQTLGGNTQWGEPRARVRTTARLAPD